MCVQLCEPDRVTTCGNCGRVVCHGLDNVKEHCAPATLNESEQSICTACDAVITPATSPGGGS